MPTALIGSMQSSPEAKRYKATHFDYCTFSGLFRKRNEKELIMHSGLMCLDFDHVEDIGELKQNYSTMSILIRNCYLSVHPVMD